MGHHHQEGYKPIAVALSRESLAYGEIMILRSLPGAATDSLSSPPSAWQISCEYMCDLAGFDRQRSVSRGFTYVNEMWMIFPRKRHPSSSISIDQYKFLIVSKISRVVLTKDNERS